MLCTYLINRTFTFGASTPHVSVEGARYGGVGIASALINYAVYSACLIACRDVALSWRSSLDQDRQPCFPISAIPVSSLDPIPERNRTRAWLAGSDLFPAIMRGGAVDRVDQFLVEHRLLKREDLVVAPPTLRTNASA
jgi:hypothetical protein